MTDEQIQKVREVDPIFCDHMLAKDFVIDIAERATAEDRPLLALALWFRLRAMHIASWEYLKQRAALRDLALKSATQ